MRATAGKEDNTKPKGVSSSSAPSPSSPSSRAKMNNNPNAGESRSFIQVDKTTGPVFGKREDSDIQEISSNYFYQKCKGTAKNDLGNQPNKQDKLRTLKEEERAHENYSGTKRAHIETSNPTNGYWKSPSRNEEANKDAPANKSATATATPTPETFKRAEQGYWGSPSTYHFYGPYGMGSYTTPQLGTRTEISAPIKSNGRNVRKSTSKIAGKPNDSTSRCDKMPGGPYGEPKLMNLESDLVERIKNEIMNQDTNVSWDDIAGLDHAKKCVTEAVVWPILRPDIFKGCRSPGRGLLLFGPPGTGKTMIGKAIAGEAKATFFYISASSLTSKYFGEGEQLVRTLFEVASTRQPAVIFVDEIDSLLSQRMSGEHEVTRRIKTQFLIEMDGFGSGREQILLIGATNRPQELDEAARRRLTKRLYIPLPCSEARAWIIRNLLEKDGLFKLSNVDIDTLGKLTEGYSGSDMTNLVKDASMGPLREVLKQGIEITKLKKGDMRPVSLQDFKDALQEIRPSVSWNELAAYDEWNKQFGSMSL